MKLSDIFKLDLNTGGGNKLLARIMNKYNIPKKEYKNIRKDLKEQNGSSSSTTSNVKYYSFDLSKNELLDDGIAMLSHLITSVKAVYYNNSGKYYSILPTLTHNAAVDHPFSGCVRCKIDYGVDLINVYIGKDENSNHIYINSFYDYINLAYINLGFSSLEEFLSKLGLTECTKEEFYDLTKK